MASSTPKDKQDTAVLPISRLRMIMKSSPSVENIGQDALQVMSKATELFVQRLSAEAYNNSETTEVTYHHLCKCVDVSEFEFLEELFPQKITVREFKEILRREEEKKLAANSESEDELPKLSTKSAPVKTPNGTPKKSNNVTPSKKKTVTPSKSSHSTPAKSSDNTPSKTKSVKTKANTSAQKSQNGTPAKSSGVKK